MFQRITPGSTSKSIHFRIYKDDGTANTSLAYNTSGMAATYRRDNGTNTSITLATLASATASYSSGGLIHVANGVYRFDLPDAAIASSASICEIIFAETTDIRPEPIKIQLDAIPTIDGGYVFLADGSIGDGTFHVDGLNAIKAAVLQAVAADMTGWDAGSVGKRITTYLDAAVSTAGGSSITVNEIVQALAGSAVNVSALTVTRGVMQLVAGDAYSDDRMQPFTRTAWTGEDLDGADGVMLFIPLDAFDRLADESAAVLAIEGTFTQTGTTVTMHFPMSAAETAVLNPATSGRGLTNYKVRVRSEGNESVWSGRAEVERQITEPA